MEGATHQSKKHCFSLLCARIGRNLHYVVCQIFYMLYLKMAGSDMSPNLVRQW